MAASQIEIPVIVTGPLPLFTAGKVIVAMLVATDGSGPDAALKSMAWRA